MIDVRGTADNTRVAEPWTKSVGAYPNGEKYPDMTFHHLIPYNTIYPFWNVLLDLADPLTVGSAEEAVPGRRCLLAYMTLLGIDTPEATLGLVLDARADDAKPLKAELRDQIAQKLLWSGWNIVEGPLNTLRADDPGEKYDDFYRPLQQIGLTAQALIAQKDQALNGLMAALPTNRQALTDLKNKIQTKTSSATPLSKNAERNLRREQGMLEGVEATFTGTLAGAERAIAALLDGSGSLAADWRTPLTAFNTGMWFRQPEPSAQLKPWILITTASAQNKLQMIAYQPPPASKHATTH